MGTLNWSTTYIAESISTLQYLQFGTHLTKAYVAEMSCNLLIEFATYMLKINSLIPLKYFAACIIVILTADKHMHSKCPKQVLCGPFVSLM